LKRARDCQLIGGETHEARELVWLSPKSSQRDSVTPL
jgi:hypothetical protein